MDSSQWEEIQQHFHRCIELPLRNQQIFLAELQEKDPEIAKEVENLLKAHHASGTFLEDEVLNEQFISSGDIVGSWEILHEIGRGGMSSVYLASRADGKFERKVAIKFLHGLIPGQSMHRRLQLEQQILARLQHKNIAQLFDAGITDEGRPYFILEYIDGVPITDWCNEQQLTFHERLKIFEQVCEAVQYAHQRLIVHRDLKPTNILVDKSGTVKLLDFGIAKILEEDPQSAEPLTRTGMFLMTPEYASPEQVRGGAITTSTDVYALGLILCEMITGSLPYNVSKKNTLEIAGVITDTPPSKPSSIVGETSVSDESSKNPQIKGLNQRQLRKYVRGDLDNIILKSLRKEPERRYGSADQLLQDIHHYQKNEPITARPENAGYRAKKFIQRNRAVVSAVAIIAIILIATVIFSLIQVRNTEIERQKTEQVNAFLQEMLASPNPYEDGREVKVIDILDKTADRIDRELNDQPAVEASVRHTLGVTYRELGLIDEATVQLSNALEIRNQLYRPPHPELSETQAEIGKIELLTGNYSTADSLLNLAYQSAVELYGMEHTTVASRINDLGWLKRETGELTNAEKFLRESLELEQKLRDPNHERIAISLGNLAIVLSDQGFDDEALQLYQRELEILRANYEDDHHPSIPQTLSHIGIILDDFEQFEEAHAMHTRALELFRELKGEEHPDVVYAMNNLSSVLTKMGNTDEALEMQEGAAKIYEEIFGPEHPNLGIQYNNIAFTKRNMGDLNGAEENYRRAIEIWLAGLPSDHPLLGYGYNNLASVLMMKNLPSEALGNFQKAHEIRTKHLAPGSPERAVTASMLGNCFAALGRVEEAEPLLIAGYQALLDIRGENHTSTLEAADRLTQFLREQNRMADFEQIKQGEF